MGEYDFTPSTADDKDTISSEVTAEWFAATIAKAVNKLDENEQFYEDDDFVYPECHRVGSTVIVDVLFDEDQDEMSVPVPGRTGYIAQFEVTVRRVW